MEPEYGASDKGRGDEGTFTSSVDGDSMDRDSDLEPSKRKPGRPRKKIDEIQDTVLFTFRPEVGTWRLFTLLTIINEETPTSIFREVVREYIGKHGDKLEQTVQDLKDFNAQQNTGDIEKFDRKDVE